MIETTQRPAARKMLARPRLRVGLVNNMPDGAVMATERQFHDLLRAASDDHELELVFFQLPEVKRGPTAQAQMVARYQPAAEIAGANLAALVVTGAEAGEGPLSNAPYWQSFTRLVDLVMEIKLPTVWSCLAAHVVVDYLDGIKRRPLHEKCSGFFACAPAMDDCLLEGVERSWSIPHSRYNEIAEADLARCGYEVLTRSPTAGVDVFIRRGPPLFLFCQGHPEYDRNSLALEFKRDVRAYLQGARASPPGLPVGAPDPEMRAALARIAKAAEEHRSADLIADWPPDAKSHQCPPDWRPFAVGLYRNWLRAAV